MAWSVRSPIDTLVITSPAPGSCPNRFSSRLYAPIASVPPALRKLCSEEVRPKLVGSPASAAADGVLFAGMPRSVFWASLATEDGNGDGPVDMVVTCTSGRAEVTPGVAPRIFAAVSASPPLRCTRTIFAKSGALGPRRPRALAVSRAASVAGRSGNIGCTDSAPTLASAEFTLAFEVTGARVPKARLPTGAPVTVVASDSTATTLMGAFWYGDWVNAARTWSSLGPVNGPSPELPCGTTNFLMPSTLPCAEVRVAVPSGATLTVPPSGIGTFRAPSGRCCPAGVGDGAASAGAASAEPTKTLPATVAAVTSGTSKTRKEFVRVRSTTPLSHCRGDLGDGTTGATTVKPVIGTTSQNVDAWR